MLFALFEIFFKTVSSHIHRILNASESPFSLSSRNIICPYHFSSVSPNVSLLIFSFVGSCFRPPYLSNIGRVPSIVLQGLVSGSFLDLLRKRCMGDSFSATVIGESTSNSGCSCLSFTSQ